jgi:hypothetical protein
VLDVLLLSKLDDGHGEGRLRPYLCDIGDILSLLDLSLFAHDFLPVCHGGDGAGTFQGVSQRRLVIKVGLKVWNQCDELLTINSNGRRVTLTRVTAFSARAVVQGFDGSLAIP